MQLFKDKNGTDWPIDITINVIRRVRTSPLALDLIDCFDGRLFARLACDPVLLGDLLYVVCKPTADQRGITDLQFGELLVGDAIAGASAAMIQSLIDFFPPGQRSVLAALRKAQQEEMSGGLTMVTNRLGSPEMSTAIQAVIQQAESEIDQHLKAFGKPSTSSPESSE